MVIGAENAVNTDNADHTDAGYAAVFTRSTVDAAWVFRAKLTASDACKDHQLGYSVDLSSQYIALGALAGGAAGVYVYVIPGGDASTMTGTITETHKLVDGTSETDAFGASVAVHGDVIVGGGFNDHQFVGYGGSVRVFRRDGADVGSPWTCEATLSMASGVHYGSLQGRALAFDGVTLAYSVTGQTIAGVRKVGRVSVWHRDGPGAWTEEGSIDPPGTYEGLEFGHAIALEGDTLAIASLNDPQLAHDAGAVFVYTRPGVGETWEMQSKLTNPPTVTGGELGYRRAVAISGDVIVVGHARHDLSGSGGTVVVFQRVGSEWRLAASIAGQDGGSTWFGYSVGVDGTTMVATVIYADVDGVDKAGAVYTYELHTHVPAGHAIDTGTGVIAPCTPGTHQPLTNQPMCLPCDSGKYQDEAGQLACKTAEAGYYVADDGAAHASQTPCDNAQYQPYSGRAACTDANPAYIVPADGLPHVSQTPCDPTAAPPQVPNAANTTCVEGAPRTVVLYPTLTVGAVRRDAKLHPTGAGTNDVVGADIAISGDTMVVGADQYTPESPGYALVYTRDPATQVWTQVAKLTATDTPTNLLFGIRVAIDGDVIVVGSYSGTMDNSRGVAYVFRKWGAWTDMTETQRLTFDVPTDYDLFGHSVAIDGDTILISNHGDDPLGSASGSVAVFKDTGTWTQTQTLTAPWGAALDRLGYGGLAISGNVVVAGAYTNADKGTNSGTAAVFRRPTPADPFVYEARLTPPSSLVGGHMFGFYAAASGSTVVISSYWADPRGSDSGAVYIFEHDGTNWTDQAMIAPPDGMAGALFGAGVGLDGDTLVVGANGHGYNTGRAYVYRRSSGGWAQVAELSGEDGAGEKFGFSVAVEGATIVVGAILTDIPAGPADTGAVYTYTYLPTTPVGHRVDDNGLTHVCDAGTYQPVDDQPICLPADAGSYVPADGRPHTDQTGCGSGMWQGEAGQAACMNAGAGYYVDDSDRTTRVKCLGGEYTDTTTATQCVATPAGTFIPPDGLVHSAEGSACSTGWFANETGLAECYQAEQGYYVDDADRTRQQVCHNGQYQPLAGQNTCEDTAPGTYTASDGQPHPTPTPCGTGEWQGAAKMTACDDAGAGYYVDDADRTARVKCLGGEFSSIAAANACIKTGLGTFIPVDGQLHTTVGGPCYDGKYQNEAGQTACKTADRGHYASTDPTPHPAQTPCSPGSAQPATGQASCTPCNTGWYATDPGAAECLVAEAGYHAPTTTAQIPCHNGTYQASTGQTVCSGVAGVGHFIPADGLPHTAAIPCGTGTWQNETGHAACYDAEAGYHVPSASDHTVQLPCSNGQYQPAVKSNRCTEADAGHFVPNDGHPHIGQTGCDTGQYQTDTGQASCHTADVGHAALDTTTDQTPCDAGTYQDEAGKAACKTAEAGYYVADDGAAHSIQLPCHNGEYQDGGTGQTECKTCAANFMTPNDGLPHTTCIRYIDDSPVLNTGGSGAIQVPASKPVASVTFGPASTPAQTIPSTDDIIIVPVVDLTPTPTDLGTIPQGSYPLAITFPDASTITTTVDLQAPYTIPLPTMVLDGTTIQGRVASSICPANIPIIGQATALDSATVVDGSVVCVSSNRTVTGPDLKARFPVTIDKTDVSGDDEVCVTLAGVSVVSTGAVVVTLNAQPQTGVTARNGTVCTAFTFTEGNTVTDAVLNTWTYKMFIDGTELFSTTLTLAGAGTPTYVYILVGVASIPLLGVAFCAICCPIVAINILIAMIGSVKVAVSRRSARKKRYVQKLKNVEEKMEEGVNYDEEDQDNDDDGRSPLSDDDVTLVEADLSGDDAFGDTGLNIQDLGDEEPGMELGPEGDLGDLGGDL